MQVLSKIIFFMAIVTNCFSQKTPDVIISESFKEPKGFYLGVVGETNDSLYLLFTNNNGIKLNQNILSGRRVMAENDKLIINQVDKLNLKSVNVFELELQRLSELNNVRLVGLVFIEGRFQVVYIYHGESNERIIGTAIFSNTGKYLSREDRFKVNKKTEKNPINLITTNTGVAIIESQEDKGADQLNYILHQFGAKNSSREIYVGSKQSSIHSVSSESGVITILIEENLKSSVRKGDIQILVENADQSLFSKKLYDVEHYYKFGTGHKIIDGTLLVFGSYNDQKKNVPFYWSLDVLELSTLKNFTLKGEYSKEQQGEFLKNYAGGIGDLNVLDFYKNDDEYRVLLEHGSESKNSYTPIFVNHQYNPSASAAGGSWMPTYSYGTPSSGRSYVAKNNYMVSIKNGSDNVYSVRKSQIFSKPDIASSEVVNFQESSSFYFYDKKSNMKKYGDDNYKPGTIIGKNNACFVRGTVTTNGEVSYKQLISNSEGNGRFMNVKKLHVTNNGELFGVMSTNFISGKNSYNFVLIK